MSGELFHPPEMIIQQLLVDMGLGVMGGAVGDWPVFHGDLPGGQNDLITVYGTAGLVQARSHLDGETIEKYGIQVRVRAGNVVDGYVKSKNIFDTLTKQVLRREVDIDLDTYLVQSITASSPIIPLGKQGNDRNRHWTSNYVASIRFLSTTGTGS